MNCHRACLAGNRAGTFRDDEALVREWSEKWQEFIGDRCLEGQLFCQIRIEHNDITIDVE